jgi:hypothetical protein
MKTYSLLQPHSWQQSHPAKRIPKNENFAEGDKTKSATPK